MPLFPFFQKGWRAQPDGVFAVAYQFFSCFCRDASAVNLFFYLKIIVKYNNITNKRGVYAYSFDQRFRQDGGS
jgi:hypothetical protein